MSVVGSRITEEEKMNQSKICVVVGAGPGNGLALGKRFVAAEYTTALLARSSENLDDLKTALPAAHTYPCDVTNPDAIEAAFGSVAQDLGPVDTLIYNAGSGVFGSIDEIDGEAFEQAWRTNALGCYHCVNTVLPGMRASGKGTIIVIGATAAKRGGARFAAFASAKAAQYNLAQSMARHLGPENIHVAYVVIDGMIDIPRTRARMPDKADEFFLNPADIADAVYRIAQQPPSAWTFEFDLRPFCENW
jgi:NAD(P)-dependent dehydrogenase (short-subunit alcohol dehydrogenase family)